MGAHLLFFFAGNGHYLDFFSFELLVVAWVRRFHKKYVVDGFWWFILQARHFDWLVAWVLRH